MVYSVVDNCPQVLISIKNCNRNNYKVRNHCQIWWIDVFTQQPPYLRVVRWKKERKNKPWDLSGKLGISAVCNFPKRYLGVFSSSFAKAKVNWTSRKVKVGVNCCNIRTIPIFIYLFIHFLAYLLIHLLISLFIYLFIYYWYSVLAKQR